MPLYVSLRTGKRRRPSSHSHRVLSLIAFVFAGLPAISASALVRPVSVCEALAHAGEYADKPVVVVGRFSYRDYGRFLSEKGCVLRVTLDAKNGPLPPGDFAVDNRADLACAVHRSRCDRARHRRGARIVLRRDDD